MSKKTTTNDMLDQQEANHAINNYTRVPNMLVDGYPELHPQDKWLFVCLVRLCGKEGTRYLSLRYIAERTGFSASALSDCKGKPGMLKRLHNAGLIHTEIKRRKSTDGNDQKNAQYHITIADTWKLNYDFFHPETCSESEQDEKPSQKPVLIQNATCSESERDTPKPVLNQNGTCSDSGAIVRLQSKITDSKITGGKESGDDSTKKAKGSEPKESSPSFSSSRVTTQSEPREKPRDIPHKQPTPLEQVYQDYDHALQENQIVDTAYRTPRDPGNDREMKKLLDQGATYQKLLRVIQRLRDDKDQFYRNNINPAFVAKSYAARVGTETPSPKPRSADDPIAKYRAIGAQFMTQEAH